MAFYNDSKFHMWRACIGAIWADGVLDESEKSWIMERIDGLNFTPEQKEILLDDLKGNMDINLILSKISDRKDRAFLAHQIRVIGHLDNDFSEHEKKMYNSWKDHVLKGVDLVELEKVIEEDEKASYHEDEVYKVYNKKSMFEKIDKGMRRILNPGDYKFPKE